MQVMWVFAKQNLAPEGLRIGGGFSVLHANTILTEFLNVCHQLSSAPYKFKKTPNQSMIFG